MADNPQFKRLMRIAGTQNIQQTYSFGNGKFTWQELLALFGEKNDWSTYQEKLRVPAILAGPLTGNKVSKNAVLAIELLISDHDDGLTMTESEKIAREHGHEAFIYPSFRNGTTEVVIKHDDFLLWAKKTGGTGEISDESGRAYLNDTGKLLPAYADKAVLQGKEQRDEGIVHVFTTDALDKHRVVRPLKSSIVFLDYVDANVSQAHAIEAWSGTYCEALDALGTTYDPACKDVTRRFFLTALPANAEEDFPDPIHVQGEAIDLTEIYQRQLEVVSNGATTRTKSSTKSGNKKQGKKAQTVICQGHNLTVWAAQYAKTFDIERVMEESNLVLNERERGGYFVECHQGGHSGGEQETFVANGQDGKGFRIYCSGSTGGCNDLDRLEHLKAYIEANKIEVEMLFDPEFGGGEISNRVARDKTETDRPQSKRYLVKDQYNRGIDAKKFLDSTSGKLDLQILQSRASKSIQLGGNVSADDIMAYVKNRILCVNDLIASAPSRDEPKDDYEKEIFKLVNLAADEEVTAKNFEEQIKRIKKQFNTKISAVKKDLSAEIERRLSHEKSLGVLDQHEVNRISNDRDYDEQFAIINTGGKALVLNVFEPNLSQALMGQEDFKKLYKDDHTTTVDENGKSFTTYHAEEWLRHPEEGKTNFFRKGMVFQPPSSKNKNVSPEAYNLFSGFYVEADPSGCYDLLKDLFNDVWVQGNAELQEWVLEWFMHPLKFPGDKVDTALAIRGHVGDGKSIVTEKLMAPIYGEMLLRVANQNLILGDYNEAMAGKLMVALEEAAFAGDRKAFNKMKEVITGDTILINPKHKAPITLDNFTRLLVISNQPHFLDIETSDRRYTILNSRSKWSETKFEALLDQWENGGAARFVHDAMNHEFRTLPNSQRLVISRKIETEHGVGQRAESRGPLERFLVSFLLRGDYSAAADFAYRSIGPDQKDDFPEVWKLDKELTLTGPLIEDSVAQFFQTKARAKVEHVPSLKMILSRMETFYGPIRKQRRSTGGGKRAPTEYVLPQRSEALIYARKNDLISIEELESAIELAPAMSKKISGYAVLAPKEVQTRANGNVHPTDHGE